MSRALFVPLILAALALGAAPSLHAQDVRLHAYGLRAGVVLDDDFVQLLVGGQVDLGTLGENIRLQPFVTAGVGDDAISLTAAAEAHYLFPVDETSRFEPYAGGGVGIQHIDFDDAGTDTEVALTLAAGADIPAARYWGYFVEGRMVIADDTLFRIEGGFNWRY